MYIGLFTVAQHRCKQFGFHDRTLRPSLYSLLLLPHGPLAEEIEL